MEWFSVTFVLAAMAVVVYCSERERAKVPLVVRLDRRVRNRF